MSADLQPDELDALQAEDTTQERAVIVRHEGPIRNQPLPRKGAGSRTRSIDTTMRKILSADHRRAAVTLVGIGGSFLVAFSSASAQDASTCAVWPANEPFNLTADTEVWVAASTGTVNLSIITEFWATGE